MDVIVSLVNLAGNTNLYINPEVMPLDIKRSVWREEAANSKSIVIHWSERKALAFPWKVLDCSSRGFMSSRTLMLQVRSICWLPRNPRTSLVR